MRFTGPILRRLTENRLALNVSLLEMWFLIPEERAQFLSPENEQKIKQELTERVNKLQLDYEFEDLQNKLLLISKVSALYQQILNLQSLSEADLLDLVEQVQAEIKTLHKQLLAAIDFLVSLAPKAETDFLYINTVHYQQVLPVKQDLVIKQKLQEELGRKLMEFDSSHAKLAVLFNR